MSNIEKAIKLLQEQAIREKAKEIHKINKK